MGAEALGRLPLSLTRLGFPVRPFLAQDSAWELVESESNTWSNRAPS